MKIDTAIADAEIDKQIGLFDPLLKVGVLGRREDAYATDAGALQSSTKTLGTGAVQSSLQARTTFGGLYSVGFRAERITDDEAPGYQGTTVRFRPRYDNLLSARFTQALLRGAGYAPNRGLIERAKLGAELSRAEQRQRLEALALDVVTAYWALVVRHEQVEIAESNLSEAVKLRDLVERQVRAGGAPKSDITQGDVTVAERRQAGQIAELDVIDAERALLDLIYLAGDQLGGADQLVLTDRPTTQPTSNDYNTELATALEHRPEIQRSQHAIAAARVDQELAANQRKIRVDVYAEAGLAGFAGHNIVGPELGLSPPPSQLEGGLLKSFGNLGGFQAPFFEIGVQIEVPIGNRQRDAAAHQAELVLQQERAADVPSLVAHDVRAAFQRVAVVAKRLATATDNVRLATANVVVQETRYRGGGGLLFDVIRAQEDLARARAQAVLAAAEQEVAMMQLERARGTLLAHFGVKP